MALSASIRSLGRAGLFTLTELRGSLPTADFLAELVREIYKIGTFYDSANETLAENGFAPNRKPGTRGATLRLAA